MVHDTTVQCKKCGKKQHLEFVNGIKNGWSKCCGQEMPIVECTAGIANTMLTTWSKIPLLFPMTFTFDGEVIFTNVKQGKVWVNFG